MDIVRIDRALIPVVEHPAADAFERNLTQLQLLAQDFRNAAGLYVFAHDRKMSLHLTSSKEIQKLIGWIKIAGREGAIVASSFQIIMQAINGTQAPTIRSKMAVLDKGQTTKLFATEFPNMASIRNSVAHPGELTKTNASLDEHRLTSAAANEGYIIVENSRVYLEEAMTAFNDYLLFSCSFKGKLVDYRLSEQKADVLDRIAQTYCAAFFPLEDAISAEWRKNRQ